MTRFSIPENAQTTYLLSRFGRHGFAAQSRVRFQRQTSTKAHRLILALSHLQPSERRYGRSLAQADRPLCPRCRLRRTFLQKRQAGIEPAFPDVAPASYRLDDRHRSAPSRSTGTRRCVTSRITSRTDEARLARHSLRPSIYVENFFWRRARPHHSRLQTSSNAFHRRHNPRWQSLVGRAFDPTPRGRFQIYNHYELSSPYFNTVRAVRQV